MKKVMWAAAAISSAIPALAAGETLTTAIDWAAANPLIVARMFVVAVVGITIYEILHHLKIAEKTGAIIGALFGIFVMVFMPASLLLLIGGLWMMMFAIGLIFVPMGAVYLLATTFPALKIPLYILGIVILGYTIYATGEAERTITGPSRELVRSIRNIEWWGLVGLIGLTAVAGLRGKEWGKEPTWKPPSGPPETRLSASAAETATEATVTTTKLEEARKVIEALRSIISTYLEQPVESAETTVVDLAHAVSDATTATTATGAVPPNTQQQIVSKVEVLSFLPGKIDEVVKAGEEEIKKTVTALTEVASHTSNVAAAASATAGAASDIIKEDATAAASPEVKPAAQQNAAAAQAVGISAQKTGASARAAAQRIEAARSLAAQAGQKIIEILEKTKQLQQQTAAIKEKIKQGITPTPPEVQQVKGTIEGVLSVVHEIKTSTENASGAINAVSQSIAAAQKDAVAAVPQAAAVGKTHAELKAKIGTAATVKIEEQKITEEAPKLQQILTPLLEELQTFIQIAQPQIKKTLTLTSITEQDKDNMRTVFKQAEAKRKIVYKICREVILKISRQFPEKKPSLNATLLKVEDILTSIPLEDVITTTSTGDLRRIKVLIVRAEGFITTLSSFLNSLEQHSKLKLEEVKRVTAPHPAMAPAGKIAAPATAYLPGKIESKEAYLPGQTAAAEEAARKAA